MSSAILSPEEFKRRVAQRQPRPFVAPAQRDWTLIFLLLVLLFDFGLFVAGDTFLRLPLRTGAFAVSLAFLLMMPRTRSAKSDKNPAVRWVWLAAGLLLIEFVHPEGDSILARASVICLYVSVLAPLVWIDRLSITQATFHRVVLILWGFYTLSACVGVLQVEYPNQFQAAISENYDEASLQSNYFMLANGAKILRPSGLSDTPGGASTAGVSSIVLGTGLLLTKRRLHWIVLASGGMVAGLFCIYICQGRSSLIIVGVSEVTMIIVLIRRGVLKQALLLIGIAVSVAVIGTLAAFSVGGQSTVDRWYTLIAEDPNTVYQQNRGQFLEQMLTTDLWKYPVGAGEGRWGMMNTYFGTMTHTLWAEMQWQALLYDGGILLILFYAAMLITLIVTAYRVCKNTASEDLACWAAVVLGYTLAAITATFSFPFLCHDIGMHLMLLNACLYGAYTHNRNKHAPPPQAKKRSFGSTFPARISGRLAMR